MYVSTSGRSRCLLGVVFLKAMKAITEFLNRAKNIRRERNRIFVQFLRGKEVQNFIIDLNREDQLFEKGINSLGELVGRYSLTTEALSGPLSDKKAGDPYNFKDTGEFFRSFTVIVSNKGFRIRANTDKPEGEEVVGSPEIIGLTNESLEKLAERFAPFLIQKSFEYLFTGLRR